MSASPVTFRKPQTLLCENKIHPFRVQPQPIGSHGLKHVTPLT